MDMIDLLQKKKRGERLSREEIAYFVQGVTDGSIPDYQISAFTMDWAIPAARWISWNPSQAYGWISPPKRWWIW